MLGLLACALSLAMAPAAHAGKVVDDFFPETAGSGTLGGEFDTPRGVAVYEATGQVYVVDSANHRVQRFSADGTFERAWGGDVVSTNATSTFEICTDAADCKAGDPGAGGDGEPGRFDDPQGIAIDQSDGSVYVYDRDNNRIQKFDPDGNFLLMFGDQVNQTTGGDVCTAASTDTCTAGIGGTGAAQIGAAGGSSFHPGLAVDPGRDHDVFVADPSNQRVQHFQADGDFVRAWGWGVDTGANRFEICTDATTCQAAVGSTAFAPDEPGNLQAGYPLDLAVDSSGVVYASNEVAQSLNRVFRIERFDATVSGDGDGPGSAAEQLLVDPTAKFGAAFANRFGVLGIDADADSLYRSTVGTQGDASRSIEELDLSSEPLVVVESHMVDAGLQANGLGINGTLGGGSGTLYVSATNGGAHRVYMLDDDGNTEPPIVTIDAPTDVSEHEASFTGTVDPDGFPTTSQFQLSPAGQADWVDVGSPQDTGAGTDPVPVAAQATGLDACTEYEVRLLVTRGYGNGAVPSVAETFETLCLIPDATTHPPHHRAATAATLAGEVNPNGNPTSYYFEYGKTQDYVSRVPVPAGNAGSAGQPVPVHQAIGGLEPQTTYHYRLVAENAEGITAGEDVEFRTRAARPAPHGRGYELVSPADKIGGVGVGSYGYGDTALTGDHIPSADGERFATGTTRGVMLLDGEFAYALDWAFAERRGDDQGWVSHSPFTRPNYGPANNKMPLAPAVSDDLSLFALQANAGHFAMFPELESFPAEFRFVHLLDWRGRYEMLAPVDPVHGNPGDTILAVSASGSHALMTTNSITAPEPWYGGLSGPGDPFLDRVAGSAVYIDDVSAGLSDSFPGEGIREPVGVCDGGTQIPARVEVSAGVFESAAQPCPAAEPGRDAALVSPHGARVEVGIAAGDPISADGSRTFFLSPDPGTDSFRARCVGIGAETRCPAQLYVRHENEQGAVATRWISRSEVDGQAASLLDAAHFEGATPDGDKVFFKTMSPLTVDDPNGMGDPTPGGVRNGTPNVQSWDLYMYDFSDDPGDDPGEGELTRISGGPDGDGDCNVVPRGQGGALRFVSDDGGRVYFTCASALDAVPAADNGTTTAPAGDVGTESTANLYVYDAARAKGERFAFVALLPRTSYFGSCASSAAESGPLIQGAGVDGPPSARVADPGNCMRGTSDGSFLTFHTDGRLVAGDRDDGSGDVYAYDASAPELVRISAAQGGPGGLYACAWEARSQSAEDLEDPSVLGRCNGDTSFGGFRDMHWLGVVADPADAGDRIAFFNSKSRLVAEDDDGEYDVYRWRNGVLSLMTPGTETGAVYTGNSRDGEDLFFATRDALTWQDHDAVVDIYDARVGSSGVPEPVEPAVCAVLLDRCQGPGAAPPVRRNVTDEPVPGGGNADPGARPRLAVGRLGRRAARRAARRGVISLAVRTNVGGRVRAVAGARLGVGRRGRGRARVRRVASDRVRLHDAGRTRVRLRLNRPARRQLRTAGRLRVRVVVRMRGAQARSRTVVLRRPARRKRRPARKSERRSARRATVPASKSAR